MSTHGASGGHTIKGPLALDRTLQDDGPPAGSEEVVDPQSLVVGDVDSTASAGTALTVAADAAVTDSLEATTGNRRVSVLPRLLAAEDEPRLVLDERRRFEMLQVLGVGGAGEVFAARDTDIERTVAVKRMRAEVRSPEALARFVDEIRTIGRLEHPNIIPIHDVGIDEEGQYYFVMKHVDGETLESIIDRLDKGDPEALREYPFEARMKLFRGLLEAVAFAHSKGIVHRDIKPANVMVGRFGEVLLMDWGIARRTCDEGGSLDLALFEKPGEEIAESTRIQMTQAGSMIGTPLYMSPEQARCDEVDERSDIYSLFVVLHELLTLEHYLAHHKSLVAVIGGVANDAPKAASAARHPHQPIVPMDLTWFAKKGLEKDPQRRYQSVTEVIDRLDRRSEGDIPIQCHITFGKRVTHGWLRFVDRHPIFVTVAGVLVAGGAVTFALLR